MKFTCLQENLSKGLGIVSKAVPIKTPLPILANILISAKKGRLQLSATNLDTTITTCVGASIEEDGIITVPAKILKNFITHLPPCTLSAWVEKDIFCVSAGKAQAKINGVNAHDFPELPTFSGKDYLEISADEFVSAIGLVAFAAAGDDSRPIFSGLLLNYSSSDNMLTAAASDGFRLSEHVLRAKSSLQDFSVVLPAKTLLEIARIFSGVATIKIALNEDDNLVLFEGEDTMAATRVLEGQFPDYKRIIPTESSLKAEFSVSELLEAVRLANVFSDTESNAVRLIFDPAGFITLSSATQETGEHSSSIDAVIEGNALEMSFNAKYLLDFLSNAKLDRIAFETKSGTSPGLLKGIEKEDFIHIVMPMQA